MTIEFPTSDSERKELKKDYEKEMANGAHLADYLAIWILGIDFNPNTACIKLEAEDNCEINVKNLVKICYSSKMKICLPQFHRFQYFM
jgi:hypothetical protein